MTTRALRRGVVSLASMLLAWGQCAFALNPSLDVSQYAHTAWTVREGFLDSAVRSIAQTPDGYLWLGTDLGLVRFDGIRKSSFEFPAAKRPSNNFVSSLLVTRDGRLWIGTRGGLASWNGNNLIDYPELAGQTILAIVEDRTGTVWAGGIGVPKGRLCALERGSIQCDGQHGSVGRGVMSLFEENGNLWVGAETGLWQWGPGPPKRYAMPGPNLNALNRLGAGPLLIAMPSGIMQLVKDKPKPYLVPGAKSFWAYRLLRDRDGSLWIGTFDRGLFHLHQGRADHFTQSDGLSGNTITSLFEDREGSIWVGTSEGLDRFREYAVPQISVKQGLSSLEVWSVLAARNGNVWVGTPDGLNRWKSGQISVIGKREGSPDLKPNSLFEDDRGRIWVSTFAGVGYIENGRFVPVPSVPSSRVYNIVEDRPDSFWISDRDQGIIHLIGKEVVERTSWSALRRQDHATALLRDPGRNGLWLGFYQGGVLFFKNGSVQQSFTTTQGLGAGRIWDLQLQPDGSLWASTDGGLSVIKGRRLVTLNMRNGLPCDTVFWAIEDDDHAAWLYTPCGLARFGRAQFDALLDDPNRKVKPTVFGTSDGVRSQTSTSGYSPQVAKLGGRLWFASFNGISVIDPRHIPANTLLPPVHIESIKADGKLYNLKPGMRLPANVRDVWIDYTALSLVAPEKIHFKYRLEGQDRDWKEVVNDRQAQYTNLSPRPYRFRVIASNNSGVWNETGDTLEFSIDPAYYQTTWFKAACIAAFLAFLWGVYRYRLYQIGREFNVRLAERVGERTRVARDLHDTLLQSFQGALFEFQAARNLFVRRSEDAMNTMEDAIVTAEAAITEGRDAIQDLRAGSGSQGDLAHLLRATGKELSDAPAGDANHADFQVTVEGPPQALSPVLQDELYRIGREILRNAFHHAQAKRIEVEIRYDARVFRLRIRDDGIGIDPKVLKQGARDGHWGLPGIRERAKLVGAKLDFWSETGAGTEVQVAVPAAIAYGNCREAWPFRWFKSHAD